MEGGTITYPPAARMSKPSPSVPALLLILQSTGQEKNRCSPPSARPVREASVMGNGPCCISRVASDARPRSPSTSSTNTPESGPVTAPQLQPGCFAAHFRIVARSDDANAGQPFSSGVLACGAHGSSRQPCVPNRSTSSRAPIGVLLAFKGGHRTCLDDSLNSFVRDANGPANLHIRNLSLPHPPA